MAGQDCCRPDSVHCSSRILECCNRLPPVRPCWQERLLWHLSVADGASPLFVPGAYTAHSGRVRS